MRSLNVTKLVKTVAATGTPEAIGDATLRFHSMYITAAKGPAYDSDPGTYANTGNVYIQLKDALTGTFGDAREMAPGNEWSYGVNPDLYGIMNGTQVRIRVATNGDGVVLVLT